MYRLGTATTTSIRFKSSADAFEITKRYFGSTASFNYKIVAAETDKYGKTTAEQARTQVRPMSPLLQESASAGAIQIIESIRERDAYSYKDPITAFSGSSGGWGHRYWFVREVLYNDPGAARYAILNPRTGIDTILSFPAGATLISRETARELEALKSTKLFREYLLKNKGKITRVDNELRNCSTLLPPCAAILGQQDVVYLHNHRITELPGGIIRQEITPGTSTHHAMGGGLTWSQTLNPAQLDRLYYSFLGTGEAWFRGVDFANNMFVKYGFGVVADNSQWMTRYNANPGTATFDEYLQKEKPVLRRKLQLVRLATRSQRFGTWANTYLRSDGQFDADKFASEYSQLVVAKPKLVPVVIINSAADLESLDLDKAPTGVDATVETGLYIGDERQEADVSSIVASPDQVCWSETELSKVAQLVTSVTEQIMSPSVIKGIQDTVKSAGDSALKTSSPAALGSQLAVTSKAPIAVQLADTASVVAALEQHDIVQPAITELAKKQAEAESGVLAKIEEAGLGKTKYSPEEVQASIASILRRSFGAAAFDPQVGFVMLALATIAIRTQVAAAAKKEVTPDVAAAEKRMQVTKDAAAKIKSPTTGTEYAVITASAELENMKSLASTVTDPGAKEKETALGEQTSAAGAKDVIKGDVVKELDLGSHIPTQEK